MRLSLLRQAVNPRIVNLNNLLARGDSGLLMQFAQAGLIVGGLVAGAYCEYREFDRQTKFRDKSLMFGKPKGPDDEPSWGKKGEKDSNYWQFY